MITGGIFALISALIFRGHMLQIVVCVYATLLILIVCILVMVFSKIRKKNHRNLTTNLIIFCIAQSVQIPIGVLINQIDIESAKKWCEEFDYERINDEKYKTQYPDLVIGIEGGECRVSDQSRLMGGFNYVYATKTWYEWD